MLISETHPEIVGTVTRSSYDARGNTGRTFDGLHDLTHVRDRAERVTAIQRTSDGKVLKGYKYGTANVGANRVLGKIEEAWRIQYNVNDQPTVDSLIFTDSFEIGDFSTWSQTIPTSLSTEPMSGLEFLDEFPETLVDVEIREKYAYADLGGRPSSRETKLTLFVGGGPVSTAEKFVQGWTYTDLGNIDKLDYPRCDFSFCTDDTPRPPPSIDHNYARGELRKVTGYASTIEYHPNGLLHKLPHDNGVTDTQTIAANGMARPLAIKSAIGAASPLWSTGNFSFDGAGNITEIGASWFLYDKVSRLKQAAVSTNQNGGGQQIQQSYGFDAFGNLLSMAGTSPQSTPTSASTNRLSGGSYDNAGNLVEWEDSEYTYDEFNQMVRLKSGPREWIYVYTVDGERIWQFKVGAEPRFDRWTLRDLGGQVLRIYEVSGGSDWEVDTDYIYRNGSLLAAETRDGERHFHLDHLGTPRLITGAAGGQVSYHAYLPFGEELTNPLQDDVTLKFTGHERDLEADGLDYMHARHCGPQIGRFTSADPIVGNPEEPQSWNRYAYVRNNPIKLLDPDGKRAILVIVGPSDFDDNKKGLVGHAGLYVTASNGEQGVSYMGRYDFSEGLDGFVQSYSGDNREVRMFLLDTTDEQDRKMVSFLHANASGSVDSQGSVAQENCTTAVCNTLIAGGVASDKSIGSRNLAGMHVFSPSFLLQAVLEGKIKIVGEILWKIVDQNNPEDQKSVDTREIERQER